MKNLRSNLEKFSKAMLAPLSYISAAGLILAFGAILTSSSLQDLIPVLKATPIVLIGKLIYEGVMVIINNLSLLFCVGMAGVLAKKDKQQAAFIALMSYLIFLTANNVTLTTLEMLKEQQPLIGLYGTGQSTVLGIQVVDMGVFSGIILGLIVPYVFNRTSDKQFKGYITQIFSGVKWSFTCMLFISLFMGFIACYAWPPVQAAIGALTNVIASTGNFGLFLYGFLERFLIPTGLHHLIYTPFQFSALGNSLTLGDTTYAGSYIVMMIELQAGLPFSEGIKWMYTGFTKTFGYFGIVAAFIYCAKKENRKQTAATLIPLALTASLASITEPIDFLFCFAAPILWLVHACISGLFIVLLNVFNVTGFTTNFISSLLMNLVAGVEKTNYPMLYLLALVQIIVYFLVFTFLIKKFNLKTPGRDDEDTSNDAEPAKAFDPTNDIKFIVEGLGGKDNINTVDNCFTRLRVNVKDPSLVNDEIINKTSNSGIMKNGTDIQIIYGMQVPEIKNQVKEFLGLE
ncbi:MAG: PTS transporter subunit EIIC [Erysipelotrichaceae bacterium]|nr:PTS transporter subunit EIIC [Erysipelotrichaceae bacterium]